MGGGGGGNEHVVNHLFLNSQNTGPTYYAVAAQVIAAARASVRKPSRSALTRRHVPKLRCCIYHRKLLEKRREESPLSLPVRDGVISSKQGASERDLQT